jgi:hypothetical protein
MSPELPGISGRSHPELALDIAVPSSAWSYNAMIELDITHLMHIDLILRA